MKHSSLVVKALSNTNSNIFNIAGIKEKEAQSEHGTCNHARVRDGLYHLQTVLIDDFTEREFFNSWSSGCDKPVPFPGWRPDAILR